MSKRRRPATQQGIARWRWGTGGVRLFDPTGAEYEPSEVELDRKEINDLLRTRELPVAVHSCGEGVRWHVAAEGRQAWAVVSADFEDIAGWRPPPGAPGAQP
jgi:hypothetical protein